MKAPLIATVLAGLAARPVPGADDAKSFVIVQPGYPGSTKDAEGFVRKLSAYVEEKLGARGLSGEYHNEEKAALEAVEKRKPAFGVVSLGFYLAHRKDLGLEPLLQSKPGDNFVLVARAGEVKDAAALKGQAVAGGPIHEKTFLERIALAGKADPAVWDAKPVLQASRALRDLVDRKKYAAVILTGRDYRTLGPLYQTKSLEKVMESDYYPPAFLVAFGGKATEAVKRLDVKRVERAFSGLGGDLKGKEILDAMGAEGFEEIRSGWLQELEGKYDAHHEKK